MRRERLLTLILAAAVWALPVAAEQLPFRFESNATLGGVGSIPCGYGSIQVPCMVDSGADMTFVPVNAQSQALPSLGKRRYVGAAGVMNTCDEVSLQGFKVGSMELSKGVGLRCKGQTPKIGASLFQSRAIYMSFESQVFETEPLNWPHAVYALKKTANGEFRLPVQLAGQTLSTVWDTGASTTVVDLDLVNAYPEHFRKLGNGSASDSTSTEFQVILYKMSGMSVAGVMVPASYVLVMDFKPLRDHIGRDVQMIFGSNHMRYFDWWMDLPNGRWSVVRNSFMR